MNTRIFAFSLFLGTIAPFLSPAQQLHDSTIIQLKAGVKGFMDRYHSPGIVVAIIHKDKIIFSEALGHADIKNRVLVNLDTRFPVLSVTKVFTATMFMQLKERNMVKLEDDAGKYVHEFKGESITPGRSGTTLLQLATHTSGLPRNSPADISFTKQIDKWLLAGTNYETIEPATKMEFLKSLQFIKKEYPDYELVSYGDRHYSNLGYSILGIALERAAGKNFTAFVTGNILKPLQMNSTGFDDEKVLENLLAKGYYYRDSTTDFIETPRFKSNSAIYAGGMYSTAADLARFISFQFDQSSKAANVLSAGGRAMMSSFRIGWKPVYPYVIHEGAMLGYRCEIVFNPDAKIGWVILANTTDFDFSRLNEYINRLILPYYSKKPVNDFSKFVGTYYLKGYDSLRIYLKDEKLFSTYLQEVLPGTPLTPSGVNKFKAQGRGNYSIGYDFITGSEGEIKFLNMGQLMWEKEK